MSKEKFNFTEDTGLEDVALGCVAAAATFMILVVGITFFAFSCGNTPPGSIHDRTEVGDGK